MKKLDFEHVKRIFSDSGCTLLETNFLTAKTPMKYICECGNQSIITYQSLVRGRRCKECGRKKTKEKQRHDLNYVREFFEREGCTLLENTYVNSRTPMEYLCSCGNKDTVDFIHFQRGVRCKDCAIKRSADAKRLDPDEVNAFFKNEGYTLLEGFTRNNKKMKCKCPEGHVLDIDWDHFKQGNRCRECYFEQNRGENHPNWNPYLTIEEREKSRHLPEIWDWRKEIYKRDDYTCQKCFKKGGKLHAHHIFNYADHKDLRTRIDNGITLCEKCHRKFHRTYGHKHTNDTQLREFLNKSSFEDAI